MDDNVQQVTTREMSSKTVVRTIDLGSRLSSKFSSRGLKESLKSPEDLQLQSQIDDIITIQESPEKDRSEELSSSQKENHLPQALGDQTTCLMDTETTNDTVEKESSAGNCDTPLKSSSEVHEEARERSTRGRKNDNLTKKEENKKKKKNPQITDKEAKSNTTDSKSPRLPYYLCNFLTVLVTVLEMEDDRMLFNQEDLSAIHSFERQKKLKWRQVNKLNYDEISTDLGPVAQKLVEGGFLQTVTSRSWGRFWGPAACPPERRSLAKTFHLRGPGSGTQKHQLVEGLLKLRRQRSLFTPAAGLSNTGTVIIKLKRAKQLAGSCVHLRRGPRAVFSRTGWRRRRRPDGGQGRLHTILLVNSGQLAFPDYTVQRRAKLFLDREDLI
ncbi:unnamed protein product, partial [Coregonus sp. 'balchen']